MAGRLSISKQYYARKRFENNQSMKIIKNMIKSDSFLPVGLNALEDNQGKRNTISTSYTKCRFSGRAKANFNKFKMSRMIFKRTGENGYLNGLKKASW
jgi:ribosomal protein S14